MRDAFIAAALLFVLAASCARPSPCSEATIAAHVSATVAAVELLADPACNADRAACPVAQAGLRKLDEIEAQCARIAP